jgi:hypothetical protein
MKPVETRVPGTLEEVLYGEIPNTALYSDKSEFAEAKLQFEHAGIGKEFSGTVYWQQFILPEAEDNARRANDSFHSYRGANAEKIAELRQEVLCADAVLRFLKGLVEDAKSFPRPVLQK